MSSWFFPLLNGGERQGLNESGIQQFKKSASLGRETCQNIGDVRDDSGKPAVATFELIDLPASEFPGREEFIKYFEACRDLVLEGLPNGTGNEAAFFERGLNVLNAETIPVLRIGDENTSGLIGADDDPTKPFYRLLRQQGASSEQGVGGGTYGIGQRAPFAHSSLRTVFYSTKTPEGNAFIAKSILASFRHPEGGEITQSKGWWCKPNSAKTDWTTIRNLNEIPERFRRSATGTDIWVTGFDTENWEESVRHSILEHFFAAIQNKQIILQTMTNGVLQTQISSENLEAELTRAAEESREKHSPSIHNKGLGSTLYYYKALTSPYNNAPFEREIPKLGKIKLFLYRDVNNGDMPDRWATMRMPRIIVEHHGSSLLNRFAAVLLCDNPQGNKYLAQLEGATHESWSEEETRNWSAKEKKEAKLILREIRLFIRDTLKEVRGENMSEQEDIPFLGRYLPSENDDSLSNAEGGNELANSKTDEESGELTSRNKSELVTGVAPVVSQSHIIVTQDRPSTGSTGSATENNGTTHASGAGAGAGAGAGDFGGGDSEGKGVNRDILSKPKVSFRSFKKGEHYKVIVHATEDTCGDLRIFSVGEDSSYEITIRSAVEETSGKDYSISRNSISNVSLKEGRRTSLILDIESDLDLCLTMGE